MRRTTLILGLWALLFFLCPILTTAQTTVKGKITNETGKETLPAANVLIKGTNTGVSADLDGNFELEVPDSIQSFTLVVSFVGYQDAEFNLTKPFPYIEAKLSPSVIPGQEVVITGSRISETILESPVSIQKITSKEIMSSASGDFYQSLGNIKEVDIITTSMGFKVFNTRGFNTTAPVRTVQFIDGMDNQAPGLNFPIGNLVGANDLDLDNIEIISGAASALYGPNAFQGVISMTTKNPWDFPGISVLIKGGSRQMFDGQFRYAQTYGKKNKFGVKVTGSYFRALDWTANDPEANRYGDIETTQNLSSIVRGLETDSTLTPEERDDFKALNNWLDFNQSAFPGKKQINAPGYQEPDLADYNTYSLKAGAGLYYRFNPNLELSYLFKFGVGTAIYQGTNRYSINNIRFFQNKIELKGKNFFIKAYTTNENAGNSYDMVFTANNISKAGVSEYIGEYLGRYFGVLDTLTNGFCSTCLQSWMVDSANNEALRAAELGWFKPGTTQFDSLYNVITNDPNLQTGSRFLDESSLQHIEGQYQFTQVKWLDIVAGASFRRFNPQSYGTIFSDTLVNPADTLENGLNDPNARYVDISTYEYGAYVQLSKQLFEKLKVTGSFRFDKNKNYNVQFSPRGSIVYTPKPDHHVRVSGQSAFRAPTLQNQFILLDLGPITLLGNLNGFDNLYTLESANDFRENYDSTFVIDPSLLQAITLDPIQPEQVKTLEFGYRGIYFKKLYVDFSAYYNWYSNFIGDLRVVRPEAGQAGEESGENAIITGAYDVYQIPTNAKETVKSYGVSIGLSYYMGKGITAKGNYTWADLDANNLSDPIIPGFNTPNHKFNIGLQGKNIYKGLGFNTNFRWQSAFDWQSPFGDGRVASLYTLDANVSYDFEKLYSTVTIGGTNITNNRYVQAFGSPLIGGMVYASVLFNFTKL